MNGRRKNGAVHARRKGELIMLKAGKEKEKRRLKMEGELSGEKKPAREEENRSNKEGNEKRQSDKTLRKN